MESKEEIRSRLIKIRDNVPPAVWTDKTATIARNIIESNFYKQSSNILIYADYHGEVGTLILIEDALLNGKAVYLPKVLENFDEARMEFYRIYSTFELIDGYKGIKEPMGNIDNVFVYDNNSSEKTVMFVPGVAFDRKNHRMGYGKGYYDFYLKDKENILRVALAFDEQICDDIPITDFDEEMDYIITDKTPRNEVLNIQLKN